MISVSRGVRAVRSGWLAITRQGIISPRRNALEPRRSADDDAEPAAADIPAAGADVGPGEVIAAQLPQVLGMHDASDGSEVWSCSREPPRGHQCLGRGQDAHHASMGTCGAGWPPRRRGRCSRSGIPSRMRRPEGAARLSPASGRAGATDLHCPARIGRRRPVLTFRANVALETGAPAS